MNVEAQKENKANGAETAEAAPSPEKIGSSAEAPGVRERSLIEFPYTNLEDAEEGAKAIFDAAGTTEVTLAQAAAAMSQSATSSGFRTRLASMKTFGLLESDQGRMRLTDQGRAIAEAHSAIEARAKAFSRVPLYAKVIEKHDGKTLPPAPALELEFAQLGVAKKQAERSRQVFERSARHAGFIKAGSDRFCTPIVRAERPTQEPAPVEQMQQQRAGGGNGGGDGENQDPVIRALVSKIPPPGSPWGVDDQVVWLRMMAMAFNMAYGGKRAIKVEPEAESNRPSSPTA